MKLSAQYSKVNVMVTITVLFIAGMVYYGIINYIANSQLDQSLNDEMGEVGDYVKLNKRLPAQTDFDADQTTFIQTSKRAIPVIYFDTVFRRPGAKNAVPGRAVAGPVNLKGINYKVTVIESKEATEDLVQVITLVTAVLTALLVLTLFIANRYVLGGLWKPFYDILRQLKAFNIADINRLNLSETKIDEFRELNSAVLTMSSRVKGDYQNLKDFTENASHEMMTPIAVITSKLDTLIQDETLRPEQYTYITDIYNAANKLQRLNQSLLLLVKIENNLVQDSAVLNLKEIITEKLHQLQELVHNKHIGIICTLAEKEITGSKYLVEILVNNLFINAIRHNVVGGKIFISLSATELIFKNTGEETGLNSEEIFERFKKGKSSEGTGLGLTIAKNICMQNDFKLGYFFEDGLHGFRVIF